MVGNMLVPKPTLGGILADARARLGLSLRDVKKITGGEVSDAYLSQIETGKIANPSMRILYTIALALEIPMEDLIGPLFSDDSIRIRAARFSRVSSAPIVIEDWEGCCGPG